jgi:hypothetical protein
LPGFITSRHSPSFFSVWRSMTFCVFQGGAGDGWLGAIVLNVSFAQARRCARSVEGGENSRVKATAWWRGGGGRAANTCMVLVTGAGSPYTSFCGIHMKK